ncbi:hypothetical protein HBH56_095600 [Parastagonospora nodorum]|nr:hypothetical protein HBH56_095600 [Parastagonospora nodorum]KAH3930406.1 hypothetical protein HBH54_109920 [Parastagonospora nodorum]KAH4330597.1 hypothetical protein HBI00_078280 [Parastagonospora nodorum]KAH4606145.1 hypothetical protein HBH82_111740 [Parastagonospora nodorum]KAH4616069.1 hypothetical protein HBH55_212620 [Parastagonospora nodorum]
MINSLTSAAFSSNSTVINRNIASPTSTTLATISALMTSVVIIQLSPFTASSAPARSTSSPAGNTAANIPSKASHPTTPHANREIVQAFTMSTVTSSQDATPNYSSQPATSSPLRSSVQSVTMAPQGADKNQDTAPNRTQQTT